MCVLLMQVVTVSMLLVAPPVPVTSDTLEMESDAQVSGTIRGCQQDSCATSYFISSILA